MIRVLVLGAALLAAACGGGDVAHAPLAHEAYVWQRAWTGAVRTAVAAPPAELSGLRVLAAEVDDHGWTFPAVDAAGLGQAGRAITAVVRIDGSRPVADLSLARVLEHLTTWRAAGVQVVGLEIDHDCATAALADYAAWLRALRPAAPLRWSITALPTWTESPALAEVAAAVDELVVQVHAVRAPAVWRADDAARWLAEFARATAPRPLRVALPTYRVSVGGVEVSAEPVELAAFVRGLERSPIPQLRGVVWFRLPVGGDPGAWSAATLDAVISGAALRPQLAVEAVPRGDGTVDVVVHNRGTLDGALPDLELAGDITGVDFVLPYHRAVEAAGRWRAPRGTVRAGQTTTVGWVAGKEITIDAI